MHIVVVGLGQVGLAVVRTLESGGHDVVAVDRDPAAIAHAEDHFDVATLEGYGASARVLKDAGCGTADLIVAVTSQDETNLVAALTARHLGTRRAVARVQGADWVDIGGQDGVAMGLLGVDVVFNPRVLAARELARIARSHGALEVLELAEGRVELVQAEVAAGARASGRPLADLRLPQGMRVAAVVRAGRLMVPGGADVLRPADRVFLVGLPPVLRDALPRFAQVRQTSRVTILGGGVVGSTLARALEGTGVGVTVIERHPPTAEALALQLPDTTVIIGDGTELALLEEHDIGGSDLLIGATADEQINLMGALVARRAGVQRTGIIVSRQEYETIYQQLGIDIVVSPRQMAADVILRHSRGEEVRSLSALAGGQAELVELTAPAGARATGRPLAELDLPRGVLICTIVKRDRVVVPGGHDVIEPGDTVILVATAAARRAATRLFRAART